MLIKVKLITGKEIEVEINKSTVVKEIKKQIEDKELFPPEQQKLVFSGKVLSNEEESVEEIGLGNGSVLHMILALRGG
ncbi:putative NEDD8 protein [Tubulinosema ratisbonensis]|uniref:Putative NEDD8 protein n=1 Tax=Tubulinosema ratisbonensis TaxID=291195 RepID=A0A437AMQ5_9MICR|nr:putative NEDD8 protein [Tubulinosema ratisbonensis]